MKARRDPYRLAEYKKAVEARKRYDTATARVAELRSNLAYWEGQSHAAVDDYRNAMVEWADAVGRKVR